MKLQELINKMKNSDQVPGKITVLQHGQMVKERLWDLILLLKGITPQLKWILPKEFLMNKEFLLSQLQPKSTLYLYCVLHDCGKPFCQTKDNKS